MVAGDPGPPEPPPEVLIGGGKNLGDPEERPVLAKHLLNRSALRRLPSPEPLIDNVLDQGSVALLYGRWESGKSFIALDWAWSVATGRPWQSRQTEQRKVLYVAAEGAFGLKGRVDAWETGWDRNIGDESFGVLPRPINLTHPGEITALGDLIEWNGYGLVVIDTLARCMVGADENSAKDCGQVVDALARLRESTPGGRGVILGVHHTGKDGKTFRGSSAFEAGADTVYSVVKDGGLITLDREKRKDGPKHDRHDLKLDLVPGTESGVISVHRQVNRPERADKLLSTFVQHFGSTGASKSDLRAAAGMDPATFFRAVNDLVQCGDLTNTGTDKRPFYIGDGK
jgi:hypothetical protein